MHNHFNDLICIPFWTPLMVWVARGLGLRTHDRRPEGFELLIPLAIWTFVFEVWLPQTELFRGRAVGDFRDVLWYTVGTFAASLFWDWWYQPSRPAFKLASAPIGAAESCSTHQRGVDVNEKTQAPKGRHKGPTLSHT